MGMQIPSEDQSFKVKGVADIVFCFDCTASMSPCIENVKTHVNKLVDSLKTGQCSYIDWRIRVMGYGDLEEGEEMQNNNDFVTEVAQVQSQIADIQMVYGGDPDESTLDAIIYASKTSKWRKDEPADKENTNRDRQKRAHKIVVVFTDARTKDIHKSTSQKFAINTFDEMKKDLAENHIKLFLWGPEDEKYKALQIVPKSDITIMENPHEELSSGTDMMRLLEQMGKTVSDTIGSEEL